MSSSRSSATPVRRHLSFTDLPYRGKRFYLDIKTAAVKNKLTHQILDLGGKVEGFLSKDLSLIITDRESERPESKFKNGKKSIQSHLPLSRGQALLKAAQHQGPKDGHTQDFLQSAANLGIKTQKASTFVRATSKLLSNAKPRRKTCDENDILEGMAQISWDKDKENLCIIKVEDEDGVYRPLFKQFEVLPQIDYTQSGSPFDVGIVLTKDKEINQSKKKSVGGILRGGYCESCDHWYKCTLREHLNSEKHSAFVKSADNFRSLDSLSTSLPNLSNFLGKHCVKYEDAVVGYQDKLSCVIKQTSPKNVPSTHNIESVEIENNVPTDTVQNQSLHTSIETSKSGTGYFSSAINTQPIELGTNQDSKTRCYFNNSSSLDILACKSEKSVKSERKLTLNEVLKNVFDADNAVDGDFHCAYNDADKSNSGEQNGFRVNLQNLKQGSDPENNDHLFNSVVDKHKQVSSSHSKTGTPCDLSTSGYSNSLNNLVHDSGPLRNVPETTFSSSCSFGENGVGSIISFLQSIDSNNTHTSLTEGTAMETGTETRLLIKEKADCSVYSEPQSKKSYVSKFLSSFKEPGKSSDNESTQLFIQTSESNMVSRTDPYFDTTSTLPMTAMNSSSGHNSTTVMYSSSRPDSTTVMYSTRGLNSDVQISNESNKVVHVQYEDITLSDRPVADTISNDDTEICYPPDLHSYNYTSNNETTEEITQDKSLKSQFLDVLVKGEQKLDPVNDVTENDQDKTPTRKSMNFIQANLEDLCRSGSSIRNWLLPKDDDNVSVKSTISELNHTLMNMENTSDQNCAKHKNCLTEDTESHSNETLPESQEKDACNLVANWIKSQEFLQDDSEAETSVRDIKTESCDKLKGELDSNVLDMQKDNRIVKSDVNIIENIGSKGSVVNDLADDVHRRDMGQSVWTDSCSFTSISDCTVYNEMITNEQADDVMNAYKTEEMHVESHDYVGSTAVPCSSDGFGKRLKNVDCESIKSGLSSCPTEKGIRINGLLSMKNYPSDHSSSLPLCTREVGYSLSDQENKNSNARHDGSSNTNKLESRIKDSKFSLTNHESTVIEKCNRNDLGSSLCTDVAKMDSFLPNHGSATTDASDKSSKPKPSKKLKRSRTTQSKTKNTKTGQKSLKKTMQTQQINNQLVGPNVCQKPYISQGMYSPISMPSENVPNDPTSPLVQLMWQQQAQYVAQSHPWVGQNGSTIDSGHLHSRGPYTDYYNTGLMAANYSHPYNLQGSHSDLHTQNPTNYSCNVSIPATRVESNYQSHEFDLLSSPKQCITSHISQTENATQQRQHQGYVFDAQNQLYSPQQYNAQLNSRSQQNTYHYPYTTLAVNKSDQISNFQSHFSPQVSNFQYSNGQPAKQMFSPASQQTGTHGSSFTQTVPGSPCAPAFRCVSTAGQVSVSTGSLSTICMTDIAEDDKTNMLYANSVRYKAKPKKINTKSPVPSSLTNKLNVGPVVPSSSNTSRACNLGVTYNGWTEGLKPDVGSSHQAQSAYLTQYLVHSQDRRNTEVNYSSMMTSTPYSHMPNAGPLKSIATTEGGFHQNGNYGNQFFMMPSHRSNQNPAPNMDQSKIQLDTSVYNAVQMGDTKLRLCKIPTTVQEQKSNLTHYWNVRKAGDCRLVFSSNILGKRKAEDETPGKIDYLSPCSANFDETFEDQPYSKRRRCLVF